MKKMSPKAARQAIILACVMGLSVSVSAVLLASFSVFFAPLSEQFGWTRGQLSLAFSVAGLAIALASPPVGRLVDRHGVRKILLLAIPAFSVAIAVGPLVVNSYPALLIWVAVSAAIGAAANTFVYLSVLPPWFPNRLGLALGIAMTGIGIGHATAPVLSQYLIDVYGWQGAYQALALISLLVAFPVVWLFIRSPGEVSVASDVPKEAQVATAEAPGWSDKRLILFGLSFFLIAASASGVAIHAIPILKDKGIGATQAATFGATGGIAVLITRLATGYLLDRVDVRYVAAFICLCAAVAPIALLGSMGVAVAIFAPVLAGMSIGAEGDLMPYSVKKVFGTDNYALIYSRLFMFYNLGVLFGPLAMGLTFDRFGTYDPILMALSVSMVVALMMFLAGMKARNDAACKQLRKDAREQVIGR